MAGLVTASRVYPTCGTHMCGPRASPRSDAIHVLLAEQQTWMPGTSPGMTAQGLAQPLYSAAGNSSARAQGRWAAARRTPLHDRPGKKKQEKIRPEFDLLQC